jgi:alanine or glycine:cation symporter, AGCS family
MVSILEPFIDTIIICTLTGLVILSSGVWKEKHWNTFDRSDMDIVAGAYIESSDSDKKQLYGYLNDLEGNAVEEFNGEIQVVNGKPVSSGFTIINARSLAEEVTFTVGDPEDTFTGTLKVVDGQLLKDNINVSGYSLIHSASLTAVAFTRGIFGESGKYIVSIGLLLFAFSTAIAWSYYGDRAMTYLFGPRSVMPYRVVYVAGFIWAAVSDTTLVWTLSAVAIVVMTLPNLFGIFLLRKEMKESVAKYWEKFHKDQQS